MRSKGVGCGRVQSGPVWRLSQVTLIHSGAEQFMLLVPCLLEPSCVLASICEKGTQPESERERPRAGEPTL